MTRWLGGAAASVAIALTLGLSGALATSAQRATARPDIDKIFANWDRRDSPGCSLAIYKDGRILYEHGYGMANLELDVAIAPETTFYVGSLSKQFTAMSAALAIQQGKLALDDPISKYLPELPDYAARITVRHLIHHTSGLRDYNTLLAIAGRRGDEAFDNPTVLRISARQKKLNFEPGSEYLYSNTGYTLLAVIVERAARVPFAEFAAKNIFEPLGMNVTHYHVDESRVVKHRADAYSGRGSELRLDTPSNERAGAGGVYTSVRDLLHWDENFYSGRVGGLTLLENLQTPGKLGDGRLLTYAWGLEIGRYRGLPIVEHGGSLGGYRAHLMRFPEQHTSVSCLCNLASLVPGNLARQVADIVLGDRFTEPRAERSTAAAGDRPARPTSTSGIVAGAADYAGTYYSDEVEATFTVAVNAGQLTLRRVEAGNELTLRAAGSSDEFQAQGMTIRFHRDGNRRVEGLDVDAGRVRDIRFTRR
jgi:CubicO group peptidase (beta-lactamase class C family)